MDSLRVRDRKTIWHPYTPMKIWPESIGITSGKGALLYDEQEFEYIDAISSWWVNLHGHSHPYIAQKISMQLQKLEHCLFAGFTHEPAVRLAERLINLLPGGMGKIFYSDNGSTAVEVALKMALQYWKNIHTERKKILVLEHAYHGDTFGAMSVSARGSFTNAFEDKLFEVCVLPFPETGHETKSFNLIEEFLQTGEIAVFLVEPLVLGAAGMQMYAPFVLDGWINLCHKYNTLVIADEVMTGFGRTGDLFACNELKNAPDIICLSKGLTGGTVPMGITACREEIFDAFYSDDREKAFYHGHSFTANPIACVAALASLDLLLEDACTADRIRICEQHGAFAGKIKEHAAVKFVRHKGTILAIELLSEEGTSYNHSRRDLIYSYFISKGILLRPIGNIIYLIPPYCITNDQLDYIYKNIQAFLQIWTIK